MPFLLSILIDHLTTTIIPVARSLAADALASIRGLIDHHVDEVLCKLRNRLVIFARRVPIDAAVDSDTVRARKHVAVIVQGHAIERLCCRGRGLAGTVVPVPSELRKCRIWQRLVDIVGLWRVIEAIRERVRQWNDSLWDAAIWQRRAGH